MRTMLALGTALALASCAFEGSIDFLDRREPPRRQGGGHLAVVNGRIIEEQQTPIETVIEGMEQAQKLKTLARRLPR